MQTDQILRQAFAEQVRKVLGPKLGSLSEKQKDLLDQGLVDLYEQGKPVTDQQLLGELELVALAAPRDLEAAYQVFSA